MFRIAALISILSSVLLAQLNPPLKTLPDSTKMGWGIQRTVRLMKEGKAVKIVYAGQSIIDSNCPWRLWLADSLKKIFNNQKITTATAAVGGCATTCQLGLAPDALGKTADRIPLILAEKPTLVIYYVYGYENYDEIITRLQAGAVDSMEILLLDAHATPPGADLHSETFSLSYMPAYFLPWMAERHQIALMGVLDVWKQYLADYNKKAADLLSDGRVHLNTSGQQLMEAIVQRYFRVAVDKTPPLVIAAVSKSPTRLLVQFNEKIDSASAVAAANYSVTGTTVSGAMLGGDLMSAILTTAARAPGQAIVAVNSLKDINGNEVAPGASAQLNTEADKWMNKDVGACGKPGSVSVDGAGKHTIVSWADNVNAWKNEFHYEYKTVYGDCEITARLLSQTATNTAAMSGVAICESDDYYSKKLLIGMKKDGAITSWSRAMARDKLTETKVSAGSSAPVWFRIKRTNGTSVLSYSKDGSSWSNSAIADVRMQNEVTVGIFAFAGNYGLSNTSVFDNVTVASAGTAARPKRAPRMCAITMQRQGKNLLIAGLPPGEKVIALYSLNGVCLAVRRSSESKIAIEIPQITGACAVTVNDSRSLTSRRLLLH